VGNEIHQQYLGSGQFQHTRWSIFSKL